MKKTLLFLCGSVTLLLASCSMILDNLPGVYSLDIQQGNIVDQAMVDQLKPGMGKRQVLYIMGSPMLIDTFHPQRWDYVYSDQVSGQNKQQKRITLVFNGDQLVGMQGDLRPSAVPVTKANIDTTVDVPKRNLDKTLWGNIKGWLGYGDDPQGQEPPVAKPQRQNDDAPY